MINIFFKMEFQFPCRSIMVFKQFVVKQEIDCLGQNVVEIYDKNSLQQVNIYRNFSVQWNGYYLTLYCDCEYYCSMNDYFNLNTGSSIIGRIWKRKKLKKVDALELEMKVYMYLKFLGVPKFVARHIMHMGLRWLYF